MKRAITIILLIAVISFGVTLPKKANALFGVADITINPEGVVGWITEAGRWVSDVALKIAITRLKKRLLDKIVDDTVGWVQGDGSPRFVTDPAGLLREAGDAAIGDTIQALNYGNLCYPGSRSRLILQTETPVFSERVSCTLTDVLGNLNTSITDFRNDFRSGGWIAWQETIKLQNNRWGVAALTQNELQKQTNEKTALAQYEASVGGGFLAQKRCRAWEKVAGENIGENISGEEFYLEAPPNDDGIDGIRYTGTNRPLNSQWRCSNPETITPGSTIGRQVSDAVGSDLDFIANADDLGSYASAIIDAAITRLTREATTGLLGLFQGGDSPERGTAAGCQGIEDSQLLSACQDYERTRNSEMSSANQASNRASGLGAGALTYGDCEDLASSILRNNELYDLSGNVKSHTLRACFGFTLASGPLVHVSSDHVINVGEYHEHTGAAAVSIAAPKRQLLDYSWEWKSCPGGLGQCPEIDPETQSGTLLSESASIPGPGYTPNQQGIYELELIVRDTGGITNLDNAQLYGNNGFERLKSFAGSGFHQSNLAEAWSALLVNNFIRAKNTLKESTVIIDAGGPHNMTTGSSFTHTGAFVGPSTGISSYAWSFISCPGQCPQISNGATGVLSPAGEGGSIGGPTFTPSSSGNYVLELTIFGSPSGNIVTTVTNTATEEGEEGDSEENENEDNNE